MIKKSIISENEFCLGNLKWGFTPPGQTKVGDVERMQTKWDRDHHIKEKVILEMMFKTEKI